MCTIGVSNRKDKELSQELQEEQGEVECYV